MTQEVALDILKSGQNVFLTGSAGTGKTYVLNQYINYLRSRKMTVAVTASTGIAATHMDGMTIHSWSGIGVKDYMSDDDYKRLKQRKNFSKKLNDTKVLIIDEISMLHQRQFQLIDEVLRFFRDPFHPFGGIQLVVCGDFFQLPPVDKENVASRDLYCFMSDSWVNAKFNICYLTKQYRQSENQLQDMLNEIRTQQISETTIDLLQREVTNARQDNIDTYPHLYTHNLNVERFNAEKLNELRGSSKEYVAKVTGRTQLVEQLKRNVTAPEKLELKKGAEVLFVRNNPEEGYVNGTLGLVIGFNSDGYPTVLTRSGTEIDATPVAWKIENEQGKILAEFEQVPLRLAWAITIHKSQGMTLDSACINLEQAFEVGQGYVALSRLRSLEGLTLLGINDKALELDRLALKADQRFQELSQEQVKAYSASDYKLYAQAFLKKHNGLTSPKEIKKEQDKQSRIEAKVPSHLVTKELFEQGLSIEDIAKQRGMVMTTVMSHLAKIKHDEPKYDFSSLSIDQQIVQQVKEAIEQVGDVNNLYKSIFDQLNGKVTYEEIRMATLVL